MAGSNVANEHLTGTGAGAAFGYTIGDTTRIKPEVEEEIMMVEPAETPLLTFLEMIPEVESVDNPEYQVQEQWPIKNSAKSTAAEAATDVVIAIDDASFVIPTATAINTRTGEQVRVTSISTNDLTVVRSFGQTPAQAVVSGDTWKFLAPALEEGQDKGQSQMRATGSHTNYAQKPFQALSFTDIQALLGMFGPDEPSRLNLQMVSEFKKALNRMLLLSEPNKDTSGSHVTYTTGGLRYWAMQNNNFNMGGLFNRTSLSEGIQSIFRYNGGRGRLMGLTSQKVWSNVTELFPQGGEHQINVTQMEDQLGFEINSIRVPGGVLDLMVDFSLEDPGLNEEIIVFNPSTVSMAEYEATKIEFGVQTPGAHRREDQMFRRVGLKQKLPISSGRLYNMQGVG